MSDTPARYERFDTEALAGDDRQLKKFVFLLHASRMVPAHGPCHLDALLQDSEKVGREMRKQRDKLAALKLRFAMGTRKAALLQQVAGKLGPDVMRPDGRAVVIDVLLNVDHFLSLSG